MKAFHVRGSVWKADGKHPVLPTEAMVECASEEDIADALSDAYGRLASDFAVVDGADGNSDPSVIPSLDERHT
ncbi:hypothetical protein [Xanthomonas phaseoli]|uniref:hypothetical protein n=1 Tax=Xanthomonas phaseoli TaxID=1985254 RepID=UPI001ADBCCB6|nr:hypothetical protein [Xanthomonas phaseoli]MBO9853552.1 hypothetical protein [Xanthomonas phaseoli pv. dieffenbachiae]MBO9967285.1 hypothetical protein [Xanthomonas phaseoli pv. dieffenbachiae]MBO9988711.1 hypothetical protein [Xanthomonas phaseoli pv. dieffenbachiae]